MADARPHRSLNRGLVPGLLLLVATFLTYLPAWSGTPLWDDDMHMTPPGLRTLDGLLRIWTHARETMQFFPLSHSLFWAEAKLWGGSTLGYHLVSILLHVLSALILARILRKLEIPGAWFAAAVFALHPVMVESVAWISELKNTLSGLFFFAAAATYLTYAERKDRRSYGLALGLFILALLSKTTVATFPLAVLAVLWWKRGRLRWKEDVVPLLPFLLAGILFSLIALRVEHAHMRTGEAQFELSPIDRHLLAGRAICFYLAKLLLPVNLAFSYPRWELSASVWWQYLFPAATLGAGIALWTLRGRWRAPAAAFFYFVSLLLPYLGFFSFYTFRYSFVADHYQYLAAVGPIVLAVATATRLFGPDGTSRSQLKTVAGAVVLLVLAALSWRQSRIYSSGEALYNATIERNADSWMAHNELGILMAKTGRTDEALSHYQTALALNPGFIEAQNNIGLLLSSMGRFNEALAHYQAALKLNPNHAKTQNNVGNLFRQMGRPNEALAHYQEALRANADLAEAHNNLGLLLSNLGRTDEALAQYQRALGIAPDRGDVHRNLADLLSDMGRDDEALSHYLKASEIEPNNADFRYGLALLLSKMGRSNEAMSNYRTALRLNPNHVDAHNNLGILLASGGHVDEALDHFRRASEIDSQAIGPLTNLGVALLQKGQIADAAAVLEKARALAKSSGDEAREKKIVQLLARIHHADDLRDGEPGRKENR